MCGGPINLRTCWSPCSQLGAFALRQGGPDDPGIHSKRLALREERAGAVPAVTASTQHVTHNSRAPNIPVCSSVQALQNVSQHPHGAMCPCVLWMLRFTRVTVSFL